MADLMLPQEFIVDVNLGDLPPENDDGVSLVYPVEATNTIFFDESLFLQFDNGTFTKVSNQPIAPPIP